VALPQRAISSTTAIKSNVPFSPMSANRSILFAFQFERIAGGVEPSDLGKRRQAPTPRAVTHWRGRGHRRRRLPIGTPSGARKRAPSDRRVRWSTFMITLWWHCGHWTASDLTPFSRMLARSIGSIGSLKRERAINRITRGPGRRTGVRLATRAGAGPRDAVAARHRKIKRPAVMFVPSPVPVP
jgi:hypothetical protein